MYDNNTSTEDNKKNCCDWCVVVGGIAYVLFFVILLGMCVYQLSKMGDPASRNVAVEPNPQKIYLTFQVTDSITDTTMMAQMDSLMKAISAWNAFSEKKLLHGLDDLRQETNNVIDKQNGWLSFWLGIFALVGALLPFLFQLRMQKNQEQIMDSKLRAVDQIVAAEKLELTTLKNDINSETEKLKNESVANQTVIEDFKSEHEKFQLYAEITRLSNTLITCKENKWGKDHIDRNALWNDLFANLYKKSNDFIVLVAPNKEVATGNYFLIKTILLQLHAVYCEFIPTCTQSYKSRKLLELTKEISEILQKISNNKYTGGSLYLALNHMLAEMADFSLK